MRSTEHFEERDGQVRRVHSKTVVYPSDHVHDEAFSQSAAISQLNQIVWFIVGVIEALLLLRIVFRLLASGSSEITRFLLDVTQPFVAPFQSTFASPSASGSTLDIPALVSMLVLAIIGTVVTSLFNLLRPTYTIDSTDHTEEEI